MNIHYVHPELHSFLKSSLEERLPDALPVYKAVELIDTGPFEGFHVWTDNWPVYSAVLILADKTRVQNPFLQKVVITYCENKQGLRQITRHIETLDVTNVLLISTQQESEKVFDELFYDTNGYWPNPYTCEVLYELPANHIIPPCKLPDDIREGIIDEETAVVVVNEWKFSEPGVLELIKSMLSSGKVASVCLHDEQNVPIAWSLEQMYGAMGMTHVMPKFRRRGFGKYVTLRMAAKLQEQGKHVYASLEKSNEASQKMHEDLGFQVAKTLCTELFWKQYCSKCH